MKKESLSSKKRGNAVFILAQNMLKNALLSANIRRYFTIIQTNYTIALFNLCQTVYDKLSLINKQPSVFTFYLKFSSWHSSIFAMRLAHSYNNVQIIYLAKREKLKQRENGTFYRFTEFIILNFCSGLCCIYISSCIPYQWYFNRKITRDSSKM